MREVDLHALENPAAPGLPFPGGADILLNLAFSFDPMTSRFAANGVSFQSPTVPVLLQILSGAQSAQSMLTEGGVYTLPPNKVIEISMPGGVNGGPVSSLPVGNGLFSYALLSCSILSIFTAYVYPTSRRVSKLTSLSSIPSLSFEALEAPCTTTRTPSAATSSPLEREVTTSPFALSLTTMAHGSCTGGYLPC